MGTTTSSWVSFTGPQPPLHPFHQSLGGNFHHWRWQKSPHPTTIKSPAWSGWLSEPDQTSWFMREPQLYLSHLTGRASVNLKKLSLVPLQMDSVDSIRDNLGLSYKVMICQAWVFLWLEDRVGMFYLLKRTFCLFSSARGLAASKTSRDFSSLSWSSIRAVPK